MKTTLVYSIYYEAQLDCHLAQAYICSVKDERLQYMQRLATREVILSYSINIQDTPHANALLLIDKLQVPTIEEYFNRGKKKALTIKQLIANADSRKVVVAKIEKDLTQLLHFLAQHHLPLCYDIQRKVFLEDIRLIYHEAPLLAQLHFEKTQLGMNYFLKINDKFPCDNHTIIITNTTGYVTMGHQLIKLQDINASKVKPFIKKKSIFIPHRMQKEYFEKFIKDIITKAECTIEGYDYITVIPEVEVRVSLVEDIISGNYIIRLQFNYAGTRFFPYDKANEKVILNFDPEISVTVIKRNREKEDEYIRKLIDLGLCHRSFYFYCEDEKYSIVNWLIEHTEELEQMGFRLDQLNIEERKLLLTKGYIKLMPTEANDWFDLKAKILVGERELSFTQLLKNIKNNDPIYILDQETVFVIPKEWMNKYASLSKLAQVEEETVRIHKTHYTLIEDHLHHVRRISPPSQSRGAEEEEEEYIKPKGLNAELRPYQVQGIKWLLEHHHNGFGALLADDMGLGKSLQTLALLLHVKESNTIERNPASKPIQLSLFEQNYLNEIKPLQTLLVLPASLIFNWIQEIQKFAPQLSILKYLGPQRNPNDIYKYDLILSTYQTIAIDVPKLKFIHFNYIILDESHYIKNRDSKIFKMLTMLQYKHKISLSGTPIENSLSDLYSQMEFINPDILGSYPFFKKHFQEPIEKHHDEVRLQELNNLLQPFILRRRRGDVLADLPSYEEHIMYSEMTTEQAKFFETEKAAARNQLLLEKTQNKLTVFTVLTKLRQISNHPILVDDAYKGSSGKIEDGLHYISAVCRAGHKVLVFSSFVKHLELYQVGLNEIGIGSVMLTGALSQFEREAAVNNFKHNKDISVFLISMKAGGVGLNLTEAAYVIILDPWWNPFAEKQAVARAHRMGQTEKVNVVRFISKDSIEEKILKLQHKKLKLANQIIDIEDQPSLVQEDLEFLLS